MTAPTVHESVDQHLALFRCPITGQSLRRMSEADLAVLNEKIARQEARFEDGNLLEHPVEIALINDSASHAYLVHHGIFFMLKDQAVPMKAQTAGSAAPVNKNSVMDFYNDVGWQKTAPQKYGDSSFDDQRPVTLEYNTKCHRRVERFLSKGEYFFDIASGPIPHDELLDYSRDCGFRVCVDFSWKALEGARARLGNKGVFILGDITNLPLRDGSMDGGVSLHTIYHVEHAKQKAAFLELHRILKPNARAVVVYAWGRHSVLMEGLKKLARLPRTIRRFIARSIYRVLRPQKYQEIMRLEAEDRRQPEGLYFDPHSYAWCREELDPILHFDLAVWRSLSVEVMRAWIPANAFGKLMLKAVFAIEELCPRLSGRLGQYPIIVFTKRD